MCGVSPRRQVTILVEAQAKEASKIAEEVGSYCGKDGPLKGGAMEKSWPVSRDIAKTRGKVGKHTRG